MLPIIPNDKEYPIKCEEYMHYIDNHRERVKTAFNKFFDFETFTKIHNELVPINDDKMIKSLYEILSGYIDRHDESKYSDEEFYGYRAYFYPTNIETEMMDNDSEYKQLVQEEFDQAWLHHQRNNSHHPQFYLWVISYKDQEELRIEYRTEMLQKPLEKFDMNVDTIIEMLCDWAAMSKGDNDYNYLSWLCSTSSRDERGMLSNRVKDIVFYISSIIYPDFKNYEGALKVALYGEEQLKDLVNTKED